MSRTKYRHVVSIGSFCSTALELERYGLRDSSYPLDWLTCPLESTLELIESGFKHLVQPEHLVRDSVYTNIVHDAESGIAFYHDFDPAQTVESQVDGVKDKYERRSRRCCTAITEPTLFVRYIMNPDEFDYLDENMDDVLSVLRQSNPQNHLLLVGNSDIPSACGGLEVFQVEPDDGDTVARRFAAKNRRLGLTLLALPYPFAVRLRNYVRYIRGPHGRSNRRAYVRVLASFLIGKDRVERLLKSYRNSRTTVRQDASQ